MYASKGIWQRGGDKGRGEISPTYNNKICPTDNNGGMEGGERSGELGKKNGGNNLNGFVQCW